MAIPLTNLHSGRVVDQIRQNLVGVQRDMAHNANTHLAMAQAQSPPVGALAQFLNDCAVSYLTRLQWVIDLHNDPVKWPRVLSILTLMGWTENDIVSVVAPLRTAALALQSASKTSYAEITTACNTLLSNVQAPDSLWPE